MRIAIAAPHPAAVAAARVVVGLGGGAVDAALAAAAALTVVYPHQCSIGGDLIAAVRSVDGEVRTVLSAGAAAASCDPEKLRAAGTQIPAIGPLTVTVPGVVAGWAALATLGAELDLSRILNPAIEMARVGLPVSPGLARAAAGDVDRLRADPGLAGLLLDEHGLPLRAGAVLRQPALARSLTTIALDWGAFYTGVLSERLVEALTGFGAELTSADFAAHRAELLVPLQLSIGGVTWSVAPPPSQGATLLAVLAAQTDQVTAAREAQQRRDRLLGDPRTGPVDLDGLLGRVSGPVGLDGSSGRATGPVDLDGLLGPVSGPVGLGGLPGRAAGTVESAVASPDSVEPWEQTPGVPSGDTVAISVVAEDGSAVSLIQSVFQSFGSGLLDPVTGVLFHNRGATFRLEPEHPGRLRAGSRPPHTLCPVLGEGPDTVLALGCQGGRSQPWILAQVAADAFAASDPARLAAVVARPRWVIGTHEIGRRLPTLLMEPGIDPAVAVTAGELGLIVEHTAGPHDDAGHVQIARLGANGLTAAGDPRADSSAEVLLG